MVAIVSRGDARTEGKARTGAQVMIAGLALAVLASAILAYTIRRTILFLSVTFPERGA